MCENKFCEDCGDKKLIFLTRNLVEMQDKEARLYFLPFPSLHRCLKITLLQIHSFYYLVNASPFLVWFCFFPFSTHIVCKNSWKGGKLHGRKESKHRNTAVWVKKIGCWGRLSLRFNEVAVWPADEWERSWWAQLPEAPRCSYSVKEKLESSKQLLRPNCLFLMIFVNLQFTDE